MRARPSVQTSTKQLASFSWIVCSQSHRSPQTITEPASCATIFTKNELKFSRIIGWKRWIRMRNATTNQKMVGATSFVPTVRQTSEKQINKQNIQGHLMYYSCMILHMFERTQKLLYCILLQCVCVGLTFVAHRPCASQNKHIWTYNTRIIPTDTQINWA